MFEKKQNIFSNPIRSSSQPFIARGRAARLTPKNVHYVPDPDKVAKEICLREMNGQTVRSGFIDRLVKGTAKFKYAK